MREVRLRAFCKINLALEILGRRDDGYHELRTIFQAVSLADEISVRPLGETRIEIAVPGGGAPEGPENLCWRAAEAYREARGWPDGARIELTKRVPSGAGLGGGSSDAAATLMALTELDSAPLEWEALREIAVELGSDVAFFLMTGTALGSGRGERLQALPLLPPCWILLTKPQFGISTVEAYGMLAGGDYSHGEAVGRMAALLEGRADIEQIARQVRNDFSRALVERWPELGELRGRLAEGGALAAEITGSGSAVFGIFRDRDTGEGIGRALAAKGYWARLTEPVPCGASVIARI